MKKISIDFDGTCVDHAFPSVGEDAPHSSEIIEKLIDDGFIIFLNTMRSGEYLADAIEWFRKKGLFLSGINTDPSQTDWTSSTKCYAHYSIDDAAVGCPLIDVPGFNRPCVDWMKIYDIILERENHKG